MAEPTEMAELRSFIQELKADRESQRRKEASERWVRWVALWIVFLAVATALCSQQHAGFGGKAVRALNHAAIEQGMATNQWSYYQSVSIKLHMVEFERERRTQQPKDAGAAREAAALTTAALGEGGPKPGRKLRAAYLDEKISKYERQKGEIKQSAEGHQKVRDEHRVESVAAQRHSTELTLALAVLQVAIAMASIAALARKKALWFVSMAAGFFGIFQVFNGIFIWI